MKKAPTLADVVMRENAVRGFTHINKLLSLSRRFVLDDGMSAFMADIGWAAYRGLDAGKLTILDDTRRMARLPHALTWIEWNEIELAKRASTFHGSEINPSICPERSGWLLQQHPQLDTAFRAMSFGLQRSEQNRDGIWVPNPPGKISLGMAPFEVCWTVDDSPPPWPVLPVAAEMAATRGVPISGMMAGIAAYDTPTVSLTKLGGNFKELPNHIMRSQLAEQWGMMRYIFGLLATINNLPISSREVRTSKGQMVGKNYRRFLDHTVISLNVPAKRYTALARKAVMLMRRRAHQVRGHYRANWRKPGEKFWIKEHQRGDASLGFVLHDYDVKHEMKGTDNGKGMGDANGA